MQGQFIYHNPTKLIFGRDSMKELVNELALYGKNVTLVYGGGSIKKSGIYDLCIKALKDSNKNISEISGVMPNPTTDKLYEGIDICRKAKTDFILAVGGGSVIDFAKALAVSINEPEDAWEKFYIRFEEPDKKIVPLGSILTMAGTGSEMNTGSVITNPSKKLKIGHVFKSSEVFPRFSILNPEFTYTLPKYQMVAGIYDIMSHICEQYFSNFDDNTSDYLAEGLMKSLIKSSLVAIENPTDYEARSNIMWTATWALNNLICCGKTEDWMVHMLGQAVGAVTNATHGMSLAAVTKAYYTHIMPYGLDKFVRFARNVWDVKEEADKETIAKRGLNQMLNWMKKLGLTMNLSELGVNESNLEDVVNATIILDGGYKKLDKNEVRQILKESL
jgi:alcohol dehydrogenase YqhD (iron-dependent ADH family)